MALAKTGQYGLRVCAACVSELIRLSASPEIEQVSRAGRPVGIPFIVLWFLQLECFIRAAAQFRHQVFNSSA